MMKQAKKRILIISDGFFPEISARSLRATELACELARQGHYVRVISKNRNFDRKKFESIYQMEYQTLGNLKWPEIKLTGGKIQLLLKRVFRRLLLQLFEYPGIEIMFRLKKVLHTESGYDLMISIAAPYPVHWGVSWARQKKHPIAKIWVADCGDPYMGDRTDTFRKLFYFKYIEKWFSKKADFISIPIEEARSAYYTEFHNKIVVIPQGFSFENIKLAIPPQKNSIPTFALAGSLSMYIDSAPNFFRYLVDFKGNFKFVLYVQELAWAKPYIDKLGSRAEVRPYIPREELIFELSKMDFLVNFMYKTNVQKSSKLINYALSGRPILNIYSGIEFRTTFQEFMLKDYTGRYQIADLQQFNISNVAKQFIDYCDN